MFVLFFNRMSDRCGNLCDLSEFLYRSHEKGMSALQEDNYEVAQKYFDRAVIKDKSGLEAYKGLADIYVDQGDLDSAESVYLTALETQPSNEKLL